MVNVKKIGAIATGALFIGATIGMAAAVTVPSDFKASMLADKGVAKAQLVVGKDAPGKVADTASAQIIADAVKTKLTYTVPGGDIKFDYTVNELDDDGTASAIWTGTTMATTTNSLSGVADELRNLSGSLYFDDNADGDLTSADDYELYNAVYVIDGTSGDVQMAEVIDISSVEGSVVTIKGTDYLVTDLTNNGQTVKMGPAITKSLYYTTSIDAANAVVISGSKKMQFIKSASGASTGYLVIIDGTEVQYQLPLTLSQLSPKDITSDVTDNSDAFDAYKIWAYASSGTADSIEVRLTESSQIFEVSDDQSGALGYYEAQVNDTDFAAGSNSYTSGANKLVFLSDLISLVKDSTVDIPGTQYQLDWSLARKLKVVRKKSVSVASGTKLKDSNSDYEPIVDDDTSSFIVSLVGGDIKFDYTVNELDDDGTASAIWTGTTMATTTNSLSGVADELRNLSGSLYFDDNADGDLTSADDYELYNAVYVIDGTSGDVQMAEVIDISSVEGSVVTIKGTDYLVTDLTNNGQTVKMGPAITKSLYYTTSIDAANAVVISGSKKMQFIKSDANSATGYLVIIDGTEVQYQLPLTLSQLSPKDITSDVTDNSDAFDAYKIWAYASSGTASSIEVRLTESSQIFEVSDDQSGALGYYEAQVNDTDFAAGSNSYTSGANKLVLLSDPISLVKDDKVDIPGTQYQLDWSLARKLKVVRKKSISVASGTKLKDSNSDYEPIVDDDTSSFTVSATGAAETKIPELEIVDEDTASTNMNLVLIGGPVANSLVAELVTAGKSKVDWYTSDGDIELVSDYPSTGFTGIIVAGKNREATKAAADALAAAL